MPATEKTTAQQQIVQEPDPSAQAAIQSRRIEADPTKEYVSGGMYMFSRHVHALPWYIDDITRDFGDDLYERMMNDPQVNSCVRILKLAIINEGVNLSPAVDEDHEDYEKAKEICNFCKANLDNIENGDFTTDFLYNMLDALAYGNKVAEQVYKIPSDGPLKDKLVLKKLKVRPRRTTAFLVDAHKNVIGLIIQEPGRAFPSFTGVMGVDPSLLPNIMPRRKFAVLTYQPEDGDPRGRSAIRPAYNPWWLKQQTWPEYLKFLVQFANPSLIGNTPENAQRVPLRNPDGTLQTDEAGDIVYLEPEQALRDALLAFRNGSVIALPYGSEVNALEVKNNGDPFQIAITQVFDLQIAKAILCQTLATEEGRAQTKGATSTHQDVLSVVIRFGKLAAGRMVVHDILRPLVEYNFGANLVHLTPKCSLIETERHDFASAAQAIASLHRSGFLHPSQYKGIDRTLNLPERTSTVEEELEREKQRKAPQIKPEGSDTEEPDSQKQRRINDEDKARPNR